MLPGRLSLALSSLWINVYLSILQRSSPLRSFAQHCLLSPPPEAEPAGASLCSLSILKQPLGIVVGSYYCIFLILTCSKREVRWIANIQLKCRHREIKVKNIRNNEEWGLCIEYTFWGLLLSLQVGHSFSPKLYSSQPNPLRSHEQCPQQHP